MTCAGPIADVYLAHVEPPASTFAHAYLMSVGVQLKLLRAEIPLTGSI